MNPVAVGDYRWETDQELADTLQDVCRPGAIGRVSVGVFAAERSVSTTVVFGKAGSSVLPGCSELVCVGCFAKLFTAMLVAGAARDGQLLLDGSVCEQIGMLTAPNRRLLEGVTVRHLLSHTHGLDGSHIPYVPTGEDGRVDMARLGHALSQARRLSPPGDLYSYGPVGAWIAAALLERCYGASYPEILAGQLLEPLRMEYVVQGRCPTHGPSSAICCPATGGTLAVSLEAFLIFLNRHLQKGGDAHWSEAASLMRRQSVRLPGVALETGAGLGWKCYGGDWYGHGTDAEGCSAVIRINPALRIGMITASKSREAFRLQGRLFGRVLPAGHSETGSLIGGVHAPCSMDAQRYVGTYGNHSLSLSVGMRAESLILEARSTNLRSFTVRLNPLGSDIFSLGVYDTSRGGYIQFIQPRGAKFDYAWNGRTVFPRI